MNSLDIGFGPVSAVRTLERQPRLFAVKDRRCLYGLNFTCVDGAPDSGVKPDDGAPKWWDEFFIPGVNKNDFRSKSLSGGDDFGT